MSTLLGQEIERRLGESDRRHERHHDDHEVRIRELERFSSKAIGAMLALSALGSLAGGWVSHVLFGGMK